MKVWKRQPERYCQHKSPAAESKHVTNGLGVSETSGNHAQQDTVGNGDILVGESSPLGDPGSGREVLGDELARGSGSSSYV